MSLPDLYSALADATRLRVLEMLHEKSRPVHELAAAFDISRPAISRHLRVLREVGLVREVKQGRENVYSFQRGPLRPGAGWIEKHGAAPVVKEKAAKSRASDKLAAVVANVPKVKRADMAPTIQQPAIPANAPPMPFPAAAPQLSLFDL